MRITILLNGLAASLLTPYIYALHLAKRDGPPAVVPFTIHRREGNNPFERLRLDRIRRRQTVSEGLDNVQQYGLYFADCTVGTPAQDIRFHIDTGSSDMWMNAPTSPLCKLGNNVNPNSDEIPCSVSGTYNANASSTYKYIDGGFYIQYADTTSASGDYAEDTMEIGGKTVNPIQFGIGYSSNSSEAVLGIGYPSNEVQVEYDNQPPYPNLPEALTNQGLIQTPAYSLWLDDLDSSTGSILFGGVDTDKYSGELATLPIIQEDGMYVEMIIALSGVTLVSNSANTTVLTQSTPVVLDSGSTLSYLPVSMSHEIYNALGLQFSNEYDLAFCSCSLANTSASIDFEFSGQVISVAINEMVLEGGISNELDCSFGIVATQLVGGVAGTPYTLGDTFLRSAYVVYDIANNEISLAPTNFSPSGSNIVEIGTGKNAIPSISGGGKSSATATVTGSLVAGGATATVTGSAVPGGATATTAESSMPTTSVKSTATSAGVQPSVTTAGVGSSTHATGVTPTAALAAGSAMQGYAGIWALVAGAAYLFAL